MRAGQGHGVGRGGSGEGRDLPLATIGRRILSWSIAAAALSLACLVGAGLLAPRMTEALRPGSIQSDGGAAFMQGLSLRVPWPWAVPSHPDDALASGDVSLTQDGVPFGRLDPSHADIRRLGEGRYDLWQGTLWFSTPGPDPRGTEHSYAVTVATRLSPDATDARFWVGVALLLLLALEALRLSVPSFVQGWDRHGGPTRRAGARLSLAVSVAAAWLWSRRWRFSVPFLASTLGGLAIFAVLAAFQPAGILYQSDSYEYIKPGLRMADGLTLAGSSVRDLGYPLLTLLAVRLGSLTNIVPLQFAAALTAMACLLLVMAVGFAAMLRQGGFARGGVPLLLTVGLAAVGLLYELLLFSHDGFVINLYSLMAETPHLLPMALALLCFVAAWTAAPRRQIVLLALAVDFAFASTVVKPSSTMALVLCGGSLVLACALHARAIRSPAVVAALLLSVGFVGSVRQVDAWATPSGSDFGAKTLFCNHLDVVDGTMEPTTPERARIKAEIARVLALGSSGWPLQGFNGDRCTYVQSFTDAIKAAAGSEGQTPKDWQMHAFAAAVATHPLRYARHVGRQFLHFALFPLDDYDQRPESAITDNEWRLLNGFEAFHGLPRERISGTVPNWFGDMAPDLVHSLKRLLRLMASTFAAVALVSTLLALWEVFRQRSAERLKAEAVLLAVGAFTLSLPLTVALSHSFDVGRYSVDILPFTVLWWCLGLVYILYEALRGVAAAMRSRRRPATVG